MKIKYETKAPNYSRWNGCRISWDQLAGNVSLEGGLGVYQAVGTGYYKNKEMYKLLLKR